MVLEARRRRRVDQAGIDLVPWRAREVVGLSRTHEGEEAHFLREHPGAALIDAGDALGLLGEQRLRHADVVPGFRELVLDADEPDVATRHRVAQHAERFLRPGNRVAIELDAPFELPHQRDGVVRQVRAVGEVRALVWNGLAGVRHRAGAHRRRQQLRPAGRGR